MNNNERQKNSSVINPPPTHTLTSQFLSDYPALCHKAANQNKQAVSGYNNTTTQSATGQTNA